MADLLKFCELSTSPVACYRKISDKVSKYIYIYIEDLSFEFTPQIEETH